MVSSDIPSGVPRRGSWCIPAGRGVTCLEEAGSLPHPSARNARPAGVVQPFSGANFPLELEAVREDQPLGRTQAPSGIPGRPEPFPARTATRTTSRRLPWSR